MTVEPGPSRVSLAPPSTAEAAATGRSLLACPGEVSLVVEDLDDVAEGMDDDQLGMRDLAGRPTFTCPPGAGLATAGAEGRRALVTLMSGLGRPGTAERAADLRIEGRLTSAGVETCPCCPEPRVQVTLQPDLVLLRTDAARRAVRVPVEEFTAKRHLLNRGFLQRSTEHANACHQDELRHAVATTAGLRVGDVVGVQLTGLAPDGVELRWVDPRGAHSEQLTFRSAARSPEELGELLRQELHAGLC